MSHVKYPRTVHLPFSPGKSSDDKVIKNLDAFVGEEVVVTEKMDGENTTLYRDGTHARSLNSRHHISRDWLKQFHATFAHYILHDYRICGENLYAEHSIRYSPENDNALISYFYGFSIWQNTRCLGWDLTNEWFDILGIIPVPVLFRGTWDEALEFMTSHVKTVDTSKHEGFVVRVTRSFDTLEFQKVVAKWVRPGHVVSEDHWMKKSVVCNQLR